MKPLFFLLSLLLVIGCNQQQQSRQYTEVAPPVPQAPPAAVAEQKMPDNPHAGLDMHNLTPDAKANLQKMLSEGQDPHAGINMAAFGNQDPHAGMDMSVPYAWVLPQAFKQGPNKGMRLASFYVDGNPDAVDCYIVSLPGMAGGMEANLKRWMGQLGIETSDANYQKLLNGAQSLKTQGGLEAKFYDFTALQQGPSPKAMIAAIISDNGTSIFVKMTGSSENVKKYQGDFLLLLKSLSKKS